MLAQFALLPQREKGVLAPKTSRHGMPKQNPNNDQVVEPADTRTVIDAQNSTSGDATSPIRLGVP